MENSTPVMYEIQVKCFQGQNYTPEDLMREWAMMNYEVFYTGSLYEGAHIHMMKRDYYYDHWKIEKLNDGTELVTIYLKGIKH